MEGAVKGRTKYNRLLADSELRRWYDNVRRGSPITALESRGQAIISPPTPS